MSQVVLITGTSTGLGTAVAVHAARAGCRVYATMRDLGRREQLDRAAAEAGVPLEVMRLDVEDSASVGACVEAVVAREGHIDVLVNNAGAGFVRNVEQATEDEIRWVLDVNFMGVVRCTKAVMPHMRTRRRGHVVTVSSVGGLVGQPFNELYCAAKFAVEGFMEALACYVTPNFGIRFSMIEPGGISSEFATNVRNHLARTGGVLDDEYRPILERYLGGAQARRASAGVFQTPDQVAEVVLSVLQSSAPPLRIRTSPWSEALCQLKTGLDPDGTRIGQQVFDEFLAG